MNKVLASDKWTEAEKWRISDVFQGYYGVGLDEIAEESSVNKSIFVKVGLMDEESNE